MRTLPLVACLLASLSTLPSTAAAQAAEIDWDAWGVPHIYAKQREAALYAFGWAQMQAHADAIVRNYVAARGRAAAYEGEDGFFGDALVHQIGIPERARETLTKQEPRYRAYVDAFVRGLNDYAAKHPNAVSKTYRSALPLTAEDVMANVLRVMYTTFFFIQDSGAIAEYATPAPVAARSASGSNAYAIGPRRSASNHAMLVINPHLPWPSADNVSELTLFEAQIVEDAHFFYGAALLGQPYFAMGFSEKLGWAHTVNDFDALDTYELTLRDNGYLFDGKTRAFEDKGPVSIEVKQPSGPAEKRSVPRLASVHGPVIMYGAHEGHALALRFSPGAVEQTLRRYWQLTDASGVAGFEEIANRDRVGYFNTVYADRQGDILFRYEGVMPQRKTGDFNAWQGIQPGVSSQNLWTDFYPASALPHVLHPKSGFVQNVNDPPFYPTLPALDPTKYPPYIKQAAPNYRAQQSLRNVSQDNSITFDELVAIKQSNRVEMADRYVPSLLAVTDHKPELAAARGVLAAWDHTVSAEAKGAILFFAWLDAMNELAGSADWQAEAWTVLEPLETPRGIADAALACRALQQASKTVQQGYGKLAVSYGSVYRLRAPKIDLPASAGSSDYGIYSAAEFSPAGNKMVAASGDSFIAVVEFGETPHAVGLLSYGNASQKGSRFVGDQLQLFSKRELRPLWLTRDEVKTHLHAHEVFDYPPP